MPRSSGQSAANPSEGATGSGHELRHDVPAKPGELLHHGLLRRAHAVAQVHVLEAGELLLERVEQGDELLGRAREPRAHLHVILHGGTPAAPQPPRLVEASSCAGVMPGTKPSGPNIFTCSSYHGVISRTARARESAR